MKKKKARVEIIKYPARKFLNATRVELKDHIMGRVEIFKQLLGSFHSAKHEDDDMTSCKTVL